MANTLRYMSAPPAAATVASEITQWLPYTLFAALSRDARFTVSPITRQLLVFSARRGPLHCYGTSERATR
jgi:hypothetical protein